MLTANPDGTPRKHLVRVLEAVEGESSGGYPQIAVLWGNDEGQIRDWVVVKPEDNISQGTFGKVVAIYNALGLEVPSGKNATIKSEDWLDQRAVITVGLEKDRKGDFRDRVQAYEPATSDVPAPSMGSGGSNAQKDEKIPFAASVF